MSLAMTLQVITTISLFCAGGNEYHGAKKLCMKKMWNCSYDVKDVTSIPAKIQRCGTKYVNGELK